MLLPEFGDDDDTLPSATCNLQLVGALPCDAWHHYYHYQSSAQYLWLADTLRCFERCDEARIAYRRSVFQDHFNAESLEGQADKREGQTPPFYDKHPLYDLEFRSLIGDLPDAATQLHDQGAAALAQGDLRAAEAHFTAAIAASAHHSNSYFGRGKCHFLERRFEEASEDFAKAIMLSHQHHDAYHRTASKAHQARGERFFNKGDYDLAISDFTKALDLYKHNKTARLARAASYRAKGNERLAREDEAEG